MPERIVESMEIRPMAPSSTGVITTRSIRLAVLLDSCRSAQASGVASMKLPARVHRMARHLADPSTEDQGGEVEKAWLGVAPGTLIAQEALHPHGGPLPCWAPTTGSRAPASASRLAYGNQLLGDALVAA